MSVIADLCQIFLLTVAYSISYLESTILNIPPPLRYFEENISDDRRMMAAAVLVVLPLHVYITVPALEWVLGREENNKLKNTDHPGGRLGMVATGVGVFWSQMIMVRYLRS
ncbi:hypothetical protein CC80DRAFT_591105 [Byssothecium circinans]|uniref:Uncharacterized protein n=1 Tax=Byssothecium circinans TaxID=147558 RepID=A0A6A5U547_9PLEO|nr:hypothetical protein CC80DRAFT_591105 [Byssothecium circinans]